MTLQAGIYRELFQFFTASAESGRPRESTAIDLPRPLARSLVHLYGLLRRETISAIDTDLADQIAHSLAHWFTSIWYEILRNTSEYADADLFSDLGAIETEEDLRAFLEHVVEHWPRETIFWTRTEHQYALADDQRTREGVLYRLKKKVREVTNERERLRQERAIRLVATPLADHLNETVPKIASIAPRIT